MTEPLRLRKALFPDGVTEDERLAARYRSDIAAEVKLREQAESRTEEAEMERDAARRLAIDPLLFSERKMRETAEKRVQEILSEVEILRSEINALKLKSHNSMTETISKLESVISSVPVQLIAMEKRLKPRETLHLPIKEPMPSFDFKPIYDQSGRIVSLRATPVGA
jgi:SMC interacting uncharacterized protein involved in chromosome segregation